MARQTMKVTFRVLGLYGDNMQKDLVRMRKELNFTQVVLEGINAIQQAQRTLAPIGTGPGPHGRIPRSIQPSRIYTRSNGTSWAESRTGYGPAIFTSEGTGKFGPRHRPYFVARPNEEESTRGYFHPGQRGTNWWIAGAEMARPRALLSFTEKVERVLRLRGLK